MVMSSVQSVSNRGKLRPEKAREAELEDVLELARRGCRRLICEAGIRGGLESLRQEVLRGEHGGPLDDADREAVERLQVVAAPTMTVQGAEQLGRPSGRHSKPRRRTRARTPACRLTWQWRRSGTTKPTLCVDPLVCTII